MQSNFIDKIGHLSGGYRFEIDLDASSLRVWPFSDNSGVVIKFKNLETFVSMLNSQGLDVIGIEESRHEYKQKSLYLWHVSPNLNAEINLEKMPLPYWSGLKSEACKANLTTLGEICGAIGFSIHAMERHVYTLSNEYHRELEIALARGSKPGDRFSSLDTFGLWLSIHSFFVEAGSVRDYLAKLLANEIFKDMIPEHRRVKIDSMSKLVEENKKTKFLGASSIGKEILEITNVANNGWLAKLTRFRNTIVHNAPITSFSKSKHLQFIQTGSFAEKQINQIVFALPENPLNPDDKIQVDSLCLLRMFNEKVVSLAFKVGKLLPISPKIFTLAEDDIVSIKQL